VRSWIRPGWSGAVDAVFVAALVAAGAAGCSDEAPPVCPEDMAMVEGFGVLACIDRYEASRAADDSAVSAAGLNPWTVVTWDEAWAACEAAGKRLCTDVEWAKACEGPRSGSGVWPKFPYGDDFAPGQCNDATTGVGIERTGRQDLCEGGYVGVFDMSGNAAEWSDRCSEGRCFLGGGSFADANSNDLSCNILAGLDPDRVSGDVGFRCCLTP